MKMQKKVTHKLEQYINIVEKLNETREALHLIDVNLVKTQ